MGVFKTTPKIRVLMVCMGNICRSPTAEGVLRAKLKAAGLHKQVEVDSAGTLGHHAGSPPDATARVGLLMAHARRFADVAEVPDPYYGAPAGFDRVLDLVEDACDGLVEQLARELGNFQGKA
jgi:protein-tyrosine phosphatase